MTDLGNDDSQISYSVTVAEEQARLFESKSGSTREERGFMPANSAAVEAMVNEAYEKGKGKEVKQDRNLKEEKEEKRAYPMFRRQTSRNNISDQECDTSFATDGSRNGSIAVNNKSILRRKGSVRTKKTHDGVIELLSSDEDQDAKPDIKPKKRVADIAKQSSVAYAPPDLVESLVNAPDKWVPRSLLIATDKNSLLIMYAGFSLTPLAYFLQTSMLSTDTESGQDDASTPVSLH